MRKAVAEERRRLEEVAAEALQRMQAESIGEIRHLKVDRASLRPDRHEGFLKYLRQEKALERSAPPPATDEYRVWFATNREPVDSADISKGFSGARGGSTRYGYCDVFVPESHKIGSVGSSALRRLLTWTDDRLKLRLIAMLERDSDWAEVASQIAEAAPGKRHAVVFIHGFNVSFEEAAIADFLAGFEQRSGAESVHIIVHSMGNQGVLRAMNRIVADAERRGGCRFGQLILAAADVDSDTFATLAGAYRELAARTTLYVSQRDLALQASAWFADYPRVGLYPPVSVFDGIDTISVSNIDLTLLGHGHVGEARDVLHDMHRLIFEGAPPPRFGLRPRRNDEGKTYWEVGA
jgi:esterase/lipase superfamily enzyme